jgi:hypothetical protein
MGYSLIEALMDYKMLRTPHYNFGQMKVHAYAHKLTCVVEVKHLWDSPPPNYWMGRGREWAIGYIRCTHNPRVAWFSYIRVCVFSGIL